MESLVLNVDGEYGKRGFLKENYRIFSLKSFEKENFEFHYHDFHKVIFFISGRAKYIIEGKEYTLMPNDILLVKQGDIHKPVIEKDTEYNRIIFWISSGFTGDLELCFSESKILRTSGNTSIISTAKRLADEKDEFASRLMCESLFMQAMIMINRSVLSNDKDTQYVCDSLIEQVIAYINSHLCESISIDLLAEKFYTGRYHLMHKFKESTGKTIYSYIQTKRLLYGCELLLKGNSPKSVCFALGYSDYSLFYKAFKKEFGVSPTQYRML